MRAVLLSVTIGLLLVGCALPGEAQDKKPVVYESPFYPLKVGNQWRYRVTSGDNQVQKVVITVAQQEPYEHKFTRDKQEVTETILWYRLSVVSGAKELSEYVAVLKDGVYRFRTAGKDITPPVRFLKLPVEKGESWKVDSVSENVAMTGAFKCEDDAVKVPAGEYPAKRITAQDFKLGTEKMDLVYWFAHNVGMVQQRLRVGNSDVLLELEEFKAGK